MTFSYLAALIAGVGLLEAPGTAILLGFGVEPILALACAAPISVAVFGISGIALGFEGILGAGPLFALSLALTTIAVLVGLTTKKQGATTEARRLRRHDFTLPIFYTIVGLITIYQVFIRPANGIDSFVQFDDNVTHLGLIASMMDGGSFSTLLTSSYSSALPAAEVPFFSAGTYPNGWHIVAALAGLASGASAVIAENAVNVVFSAVVFPLGVLGLLSKAFDRDKTVALCGAFVCLASTAFPLRMLTVHGAFPNFAAFCFIPAISTLLLRLLPARSDHPVCWNELPIFLVASIGLIITHPNAVFSCAIVLLPYLVLRFIPSLLAHLKQGIKPAVVRGVQTGVLVAFALLWMLGTRLGPFISIANFVWEFSKTAESATSDVISAGYFVGLAQPLLALFVAVGFAVCLTSREHRWISASYLLVALVFSLGLCLDFETRKLVTGYWYNDPERTAGLLAIAAVPLASVGLSSICQALAALVGKVANLQIAARKGLAFAFVLVAALVFSNLNYSEEFTFALSGEEESAYHFASNQVVGVYTFNDEQVYTQDERDFVARVKEIVPEGELVLNAPFDGSVFAYPSEDLNVYYKSCRPGGETEESELIRTSLNQIATNEDVQEAVASTGASYLLVLDGYGWDEDVYTALGDYWPALWSGLEVDDDTPGFDVVLAEGNMRLYRIVV